MTNLGAYLVGLLLLFLGQGVGAQEVKLLPGYAMKYALETQATKEAVWELWENVETWKRFDERLETSYLKAGHKFGLGAIGYVKAHDGPRTRFEITYFEAGSAFVETLYLPLYQSIELHRYFELSDTGQTVFVHEVRFKGRLRSIFYWALCRAFKKDLKKVMHQMKLLLEVN